MARVVGPVRRRHRVATLAALSLLLGLVITILVSWGVAVYGDPTRGELAQGMQRLADGPRLVPEGWITTTLVRVTMYESSSSTIIETLCWYGQEPDRAEFQRDRSQKSPLEADSMPWWSGPLGPSSTLQQEWSRKQALVVGELRVRQATGFPCRALTGDLQHMLLTSQDLYAMTSPPTRAWKQQPLPREHALPTGLVVARTGQPRTLPLLPLWRGVLINSVFYAPLGAVLVLLASGVRERWRSRRGHCPNCNYNLRHSDEQGCPECGWGREGATLEQESETCDDC